jgi:GH15 family glucan-1,4-alpha-glucosidase
VSGLSGEGKVRHTWEGYSILGNGNLTVVYSDDPRISAKTNAMGVQHLYFSDYTADYVAATSFKLADEGGKTLAGSKASQVGMKNFFTVQTQTRLANGGSGTVLCLVHPQDAVILSLNVNGSAEKIAFRFEAQLRKEIKTDQQISLTSLKADGNGAIAAWSNGVAIAIVPHSAHAKTSVSESSVSISGDVTAGQPEEVLLVPGSSVAEVQGKIWALQQQNKLESAAGEYWERWMNAGKIPSFKTSDEQSTEYLEAFKRNLYCVKSASLHGQIPADITGQFVTNNMPQLYPRDAMMCARVLLATGHAAEARQVIEFWANRAVPMKSPGEWYARYDAHARAVDGGSGARYDEPEWDANGYFIYLVKRYHEATGEWLIQENLLYELADFLVHHLDSNGLLYEGGIVEWTGYLPATNMIDSAALKVAAEIAEQFGDKTRAESYAKAAKTISEAMPQMFDETRQTYADVRFAASKGANNQSIGDKSGKKVYLWDTTANVGIIWGFSNHHDIAASNVFYANHTVGMGGGMRYFDSPEARLAEYGHGFFFFTTAAAAEYEFLQRHNGAGKKFLDWMLRNANSYGLMPEHISPDGLHCSPATPLSWCSAEFAAAVLLCSQTQ